MKPKAYKSTVIAWKTGQGYGFIANPSGKDDLFLHINDIQGKRVPETGDSVRFRLKPGTNGKLLVYNASLTKHNTLSAVNWALTGFVTAIPFVLSILTLRRSELPLALYTIMSTLCYFMIRSDKRRAATGRWRIADNSMHLAQILWGWPGALIALKVYRHKAGKKAFQGTLHFIIFIHLFFWMDTLILDHLSLNFIISVLEYCAGR